MVSAGFGWFWVGLDGFMFYQLPSTKLPPGAGFLSVFFCPAKLFCPGVENLTTLKNPPGSARGGGMLVLGID